MRIVALLATLWVAVHAGYHSIDMILDSGQELGWRFGIKSRSDEGWWHGAFSTSLSPDPIISAQLYVDHVKPLVPGQHDHLWIVILHDSELERLGQDHGDRVHRCCDSSPINSGSCSNPGLPIIMSNDLVTVEEDLEDSGDPDRSQTVYVHRVSLENATTQFSFSHAIRRTGIYYLVILNCDDSLNPHLAGQVQMLNTWGFLGVTEFPSLVFYSVALWVYIASLVAWFVWCLFYFRVLFFLQAIVGLLFALGFIEMGLWYSELTFYNALGTVSTTLVGLCVAATAAKRTVTRVTVLLTSIGYGIEHPSLPDGTLWRLVPLSALYVVSSGWLHSLDITSRSQLHPTVGNAALLVLVSVLDTMYYYWTFYALSVLLKRLSQKTTARARAKYHMYKRLWWILLLAAVFSIALIFSQVAVVSAAPTDETWLVLWWVRFALWDAGYYVLLLAVAFLLRPSGGAKGRFSLEEDDEDAKRASSVPLEQLRLPPGVELMLEEVEDKEETDVKAD